MKLLWNRLYMPSLEGHSPGQHLPWNPQYAESVMCTWTLMNSKKDTGTTQIKQVWKGQQAPPVSEPTCIMQTVWFCSHISFASFQLMVFSSSSQLTSTQVSEQKECSFSVISPEQNLYHCRHQVHVSVLDTFWALKCNPRRWHVAHTGHPWLQSPPGAKCMGSEWQEQKIPYPFTGFLQIWRSVSCVIACVPSIRAALIFFLFAVLIIFISRRFSWLLGGFLK